MKFDRRLILGLMVLGGAVFLGMLALFDAKYLMQRDCGHVSSADDAQKAECFIAELADCRSAKVQIGTGIGTGEENYLYEVLPDCKLRVTNLETLDVSESIQSMQQLLAMDASDDFLKESMNWMIENTLNNCSFPAGIFKDCEMVGEFRDALTSFAVKETDTQAALMLLGGLKDTEECDGELHEWELKCFNPVEYVARYGTSGDCASYNFQFESDREQCFDRMAQLSR